MVERSGLVFLENTRAHFLALPSLKTPDPLVSLKIRNFSIMSYFFLPPVETQSNSFTLTACSQQKEKRDQEMKETETEKTIFYFAHRGREKKEVHEWQSVLDLWVLVAWFRVLRA